MLDLVRKGQAPYDFDDLKALLNLQCGIDQSSKDGGATAGPNGADGGPLSASGDRNRRQYNEYLIVRWRGLCQSLSLVMHALMSSPACRSCSRSIRQVGWRTIEAL